MTAHAVIFFMILFMISGTPYRNQLGVGQHTLFSFMFFLIAVYACQKNEERKDPKKFKLSIAVPLAVSYFKYTLTAPLALYFLYKKIMMKNRIRYAIAS